MSEPLTVGVNLLYLRPGQVGGSEVYVRALLERLANRADIRLRLFCSAETSPSFATFETISVFEGPYSLAARLRAENWQLARALGQHPVDLLWSPANFGAPFLPLRVPQVATVHDLQHLCLPELFTKAKRMQRTAMFRATFKRCQQIIAISEFTRNDVIERFGVSETHIHTILEGFDPHIQRDPQSEQATRKKYRLNRPFFYFPSTDSTHKNHETLLQAYAALKVPVDLVFTGSTGHGSPPLPQRIEAMGLSQTVHALGFVDRHVVYDLMFQAEALVYPSRFEGFGLPLLEAMQCDTPVIASQSGSIPEVAGNAALLVDASDTTGWTAALQRMLDEPALRTKLVARGRENLKRFSWERCAVETVDIFRRAAQK